MAAGGEHAAVRGGAVDATARAHRAVAQGLRGHRHDAEGHLRLPQAQLRRKVSQGHACVTATHTQRLDFIFSMCFFFIMRVTEMFFTWCRSTS